MVEFKPQPVPDPMPQPGMTASSYEGLSSGDGTFGPPPGKFKQFYQNNKWYFWAIILGIVIIAGLAFFAFREQAPEPTEAANVLVLFDAPDTAPAGDEVVYKINVQNRDSAKLENITLEMIYDDGISYISSVPPSENSSGSRFKVPDLPSDGSAALMIKTNVNGNIGEDKKVIAKLHYRFSNFNSTFTQKSEHIVRLAAGDIVLDMTGPQKATNVQTANYDIYFRNDSDKAIDGAQIKVTYPNEFKYNDANPKPSIGQNIWDLNKLEPNASGKIEFNGNFKGTRAGQSVIFKIEFLARDSTGNTFTQSSSTYMTTIEATPLSAELRTANEIQGGIVNPGESIQYEVKFQNNTPVAATGINVVVDLDSKAVDMSKVRAENALISGNTITWNAASVSKLEKLDPNQSGTFQFSIQLKKPAVTDNSENITVVAKTRIKSNENPTFINGSEVSLKVSSPSSMERSVISVSGPTPPKVGQSTTMQVIVSLRNSSNDYRDGVLIGYIPLGVTFDKSSLPGNESASVKFDAATGKLTWNVGQLAAHSGSTAPLRSLKFNVKVTPSDTQFGQSILLLKNIAFTAKDTFTNQNISLSAQELSTDQLPGEGNGRVVR